MGHSASAPTMPIEVFEQRKRESYQSGNEDPSSLDRWLEGGSVSTGTTATTASRYSRGLSELTKTSMHSGSVCSEPGTMHQMQYRQHRRGFAINKPQQALQDPFEAGNLKDGVPNIGWPDKERLVTTMREQFANPREQPHANISKEMYSSVIQSNQHPFIEKFLDGSCAENRDQFMGMVRSLDYLRTAKEKQTKTQMAEDLNLAENQRLFKPSRARPWFDSSQANISMIPLGTLGKHGPKKEPPPQPPPMPVAHPAVPPSPAVSSLMSLPLSRLSTPQVGGRGLPFASPSGEVDYLAVTH